METLNETNTGQAIVPPTWEQMNKELPSAVNAMVMSAMGMSVADSNTMPIWYVLAKAAGATGMPLMQLYNDPVVRQHALATMAVDAAASQKMHQHHQQQNEMHERQQQQAQAHRQGGNLHVQDGGSAHSQVNMAGGMEAVGQQQAGIEAESK